MPVILANQSSLPASSTLTKYTEECVTLNANMAASVLSRVLRPLHRTAINPIRGFHKPWPVSVSKRQKSSSSQPSSVEKAKEVNWKCRQDLATALRGLHWYGLSEGVCTHLTMIAPALSGDGEVMLMIPHGLHWSQVCNTFHFRLGSQNSTLFRHFTSPSPKK